MSLLNAIISIFNRPKNEKITKYKFTGPNAKEEAAKFIASINPDQVLSIDGINHEEMAGLVIDHKHPHLREIKQNTLKGDVTGNEYIDLTGWVFCANLNFRTPLAILEHHGFIAKQESEKFYDENFGIWLPVFLNEDRPEVSWNQSSIFGSVRSSDVLPILIRYREIIEGTDPLEKKIERLKEMSTFNSDWKNRINYALSGKYSDMSDYWIMQNLTSIKGIGPVKARKLISQGIYTIEQYKDENVDQR